MTAYRGYGCSDGNMSSFDCEIKLYEPKAFKYSDTIEGQIIINTQSKIHFKSLRIQLEGETRCRFQHKQDNGLTHHLKTDSFFPSEEFKTLDSDKTCVYIIGKKGGSGQEEIKTFPRGEHIFPFQLELLGTSFPSSFQSANGSIDYRLAVHALSRKEDSAWTEASPNSIRIRIKGHYNLSTDPANLKPFTVAKKKKSKSVFTKQPISKVNLYLAHRGHLPQSNFPCQVTIRNPTNENISTVQVDLVQKINYYDNKVCKTSVTLLDSAVDYCDSSDRDIKSELVLKIPMETEPTFTLGPRFIEILYFLEFSVTASSGLGVIGETSVVIGTCERDGAGSSASGGQNKDPEDEWDSNSNQLSTSLPPSYSSLSVRRPVIEPISVPPPPSYNKAVGIDDWEEFNPFRPR